MLLQLFDMLKDILSLKSYLYRLIMEVNFEENSQMAYQIDIPHYFIPKSLHGGMGK